MTPLTEFERCVLEACLRGQSDQLAVLRQQASAAMVSARIHNACGSYVDFVVPDSLPRVEPGVLVIDDVHIAVKGVEPDPFCILYVVDGRLHFIEFASVNDDWPEAPTLVRIGYKHDGSDQDSAAPDRDPDMLARMLRGRPYVA